MKKISIKNKGAAITEAIIIIPVLLTMLYGLYHVWRVSIIISDATVAARSELIVHSLTLNASSELNNPNWRYGKAGFSPDAQFYSNMGMFPGVAASDIRISTRSEEYDYENGPPNVYDTMRAAMTGAVSVRVTVPLPGQPFLHGGEEYQDYTATATCSVNPWALNQKQFFGATLEWIDKMRNHDVPANVDYPNLLHNVTPLEKLPGD